MFQMMKEKNLQPKILYSVRLSFKYYREINRFQHKQKLREFIITGIALQTLKELQ